MGIPSLIKASSPVPRPALVLAIEERLVLYQLVAFGARRPRETISEQILLNCAMVERYDSLLGPMIRATERGRDYAASF